MQDPGSTSWIRNTGLYFIYWYIHHATIYISVADPVSGAFFDPWIRDPGWVKKQDPDPG